ncbi:MAG: hypothetical protein NC204_07260 [Candidatus Amulumruptor caecigallinarius]|nr:hypothetical protein [Candidatus Amulumruptor caecigallinarius]
MKTNHFMPARICGLIPILLLLFFTSGCSHHDNRIAPYGWTRVEPEFDSITLNLERLYVLQKSPDSIAIYVKRLRQIADMNPGKPLLNSRATFWEGRMQYTLGDCNGGLATMNKALMMTDSALNPFDFHRIMWNIDMDYHEPTLNRYNHLVKEYTFFREHGDDVVAAALGMEIGVFLIKLGDTGHGIPYLYEADSLFIAAGFPGQAANNRINHADALAIAGDTLKAAKMLREILTDTVFPISEYSRDIAVGNLYNYVGDTTALREAYDIVKKRVTMDEAACLYENFLTDLKISMNQFDSAQIYNERASRRLGNVWDPHVVREFYKMRSQLFAHHNMPDSAYAALAEYARLNDSILSSDMDCQIRNSVILGDIRKSELERNIKHERFVNTLLFVIILTLVTGCAAGFFMYRRLQRQRLENVKTSLGKQRADRRANAMKVVLDEKENLITELEHTLAEIDSREGSSKPDIARVRSVIKAHGANREINNSFIESVSNMGIRFSERLQSDYPSLTAADLRLANLIALGMETKHVARVMGIRPESVKQARWRLRSKMGLGSGENLEQALRKYSPDGEE